MKDEWDTAGGRLRWAIQKFGPRPTGRRQAEGSIRSFHLKLTKEHGYQGRGATRQMLHRYLHEDGPDPPDEFLRAAAAVLYPVREQWLATKEGSKTEMEAKAERVSAALISEGQEEAEKLRAAIWQVFFPNEPVSPSLGSTQPGAAREEDSGDRLPSRPTGGDVPYWIPSLAQVELRLWVDDEFGSEASPESRKESIASALFSPLEAFGIDPIRMHHEARKLSDYIVAITPALLILADERGRQRREARLPPRESLEEEEERLWNGKEGG